MTMREPGSCTACNPAAGPAGFLLRLAFGEFLKTSLQRRTQHLALTASAQPYTVRRRVKCAPVFLTGEAT